MRTLLTCFVILINLGGCATLVGEQTDEGWYKIVDVPTLKVLDQEVLTVVITTDHAQPAGNTVAVRVDYPEQLVIKDGWVYLRVTKTTNRGTIYAPATPPAPKPAGGFFFLFLYYNFVFFILKPNYFVYLLLLMKNPVPFYPQKWDLDKYQEFGFKTKAEAEKWEDSSCGILCLKMAIDYSLTKQNKPLSPTIAEYITKGLKLDAYIDPIGWSHDGLIKLANSFNFTATRQENILPNNLRQALDNGYLPIISIKWAFVNNKNWKERLLFWKKFGGHLALIIGYELDQNSNLTGFYVHHTSIRQEYNWPNKLIDLDTFQTGFTGRCILLKT